MPLRRGRKLRDAIRDVFTVSRRTGKEALRGLGYLRLLRFIAPAGQLGCGRTPTAVEDPGWRRPR